MKAYLAVCVLVLSCVCAGQAFAASATTTLDTVAEARIQFEAARASSTERLRARRAEEQSMRDFVEARIVGGRILLTTAMLDRVTKAADTIESRMLSVISKLENTIERLTAYLGTRDDMEARAAFGLLYKAGMHLLVAREHAMGIGATIAAAAASDAPKSEWKAANAQVRGVLIEIRAAQSLLASSTAVLGVQVPTMSTSSATTTSASSSSASSQ